MRKRLGCLSTGGLAAALLTLLVLAGVIGLWGGAPFSPGPLNARAGQADLGGVRSHAAIGGQCSACHAAPWSGETMSDRCLLCHVDIARQLLDPSSLHGVLIPAGESTECYACHTEHQGPEAPLTIVDPDRFPHEVTGYSLQAHRQTEEGLDFACAGCHGADITRFEPATCGACHRDLDAAYMQGHQETFGMDCLACHDGIDTYGQAFDHNQQEFPLEGQHARLSCSGCHLAARSLADLQAAPRECYACHAEDDAHDGQLGQDCAGCHVTEDWQQATFDHAQTAFPLTGRHTAVDCRDCHIGGVFQGTPQDCYACHAKDDVHEGQFGQDCAGCHTTEDWQQATFDHGQPAFPLTGRHTGVDCRDCHTGGVFQGTSRDCGACHEDPVFHLGLLGVECDTCHTTGGWTPARYDRPHTFPISHGESGSSPCRTCHPDTLAAYTCYDCHEHNPAGIESEHREEGISDFQDCVRCHPTGREDEAEDEGGGGDD